MLTQSKIPQGGSMTKVKVSFCGFHTNFDFTRAASLLLFILVLIGTNNKIF